MNFVYFFCFFLLLLNMSFSLVKSRLKMIPPPCVVRVDFVKYLSLLSLYAFNCIVPRGLSRYITEKSPTKFEL